MKIPGCLFPQRADPHTIATKPPLRRSNKSLCHLLTLNEVADPRSLNTTWRYLPKNFSGILITEDIGSSSTASSALRRTQTWSPFLFNPDRYLPGNSTLWTPGAYANTFTDTTGVHLFYQEKYRNEETEIQLPVSYILTSPLIRP